MSACYSVYLGINVKDQEGATKALQQKIANGHNERTNYSLDKHKEDGLEPDTLENCIRIFLAEWRYCHQIVEKFEYPDYVSYNNCFNASYGWEEVMIQMFESLAPFIGDGSVLEIYPDSGKTEYKIENGKAVCVE